LLLRLLKENWGLATGRRKQKMSESASSLKIKPSQKQPSAAKSHKNEKRQQLSDLTCFLGLKAEPLLQNYAKVKANLSLCQDKF